MTSKVRKQTLQPPFEPENEDSRRQYILRRVRGVPVPPYPALSRGETPYDLIASWIQNSSIPWAKSMRDDLHYLLRESLSNINKSMSEVEFWELGGLLALAARLRDKECGKIVASFMAGSSSESLSGNFMSIFDKDGLYCKVGELMFKVIDMTSPEGDQALFEAGIKVALSASEGASLLSGLARRNPLRAKEIAPAIIKHTYKESNQKALVYIIRLLREACWVKDDIMTLTKVRDMFFQKSPEFREFVADALVTIFPTWDGNLYARELREKSLSSPEFRNRANRGTLSWQSYY
ncbi:MAG: hypothetical protein JSV88_01260 [Candidatus Aminicenantes bacterium]|nr:MAG: hypothetical protein JSV88_01260 [Candidatus Aminicenantes bacterium]